MEILQQEMLPIISFKKFFDDYKKVIHKFPMPETDLDIQKALGLENDTEHFKEIENACSLNTLDHPDDTPVLSYAPGFSEKYRISIRGIPNSKAHLKTYKMLNESKQNSHSNPFQRSHESFKRTQFPTFHKETNVLNHYEDIIVTIRTYRPVRVIHVGKNLENPVFAEEFCCLGSNFLTELRDKISCICNKYRFFDISENPTAPMVKKDIDPGFFFITDTFYNDHRRSNNIDYSVTIKEWAKTARGLGNIKWKTANMDDTRFIDISASLGYPQLYQHHGNCEHMFVFSQIEIISPGSHNLPKEFYPFLSSFNFHNDRLCQTCCFKHFSFIVENSDRQIHNPSYLCHDCFYSYHYLDGKKIGKFKAYRIKEIDENYDDSDEYSSDHSDDHEKTIEHFDTENKNSNQSNNENSNADQIGVSAL